MPRSRRRRFSTACPRGRRPCVWCWAPAGGSRPPAAGSPSRRPPDSRSPSCAVTVGPARTGRCRRHSTVRGSPYTGPGVAAAALGMDKLAFGGVMVAAGIADIAPAGADARRPRTWGSTVPTSSSLVSAVPPSASRWSRIWPRPGRSSSAEASTCAPARSSSRFAPTSTTSRWPCAAGRRRRCRPSSARCGRPDRPAAARRDPRLHRQVRGGRRHGQRPRELPAELSAGRGRRGAPGGPPHRGSRARPRGGPDRFPDRRRRVAGERDQHHSRLVGPLPVDRPRRALRHAAGRHDRRGDAPGPPSSTAPPEPTVWCCAAPRPSRRSWPDRDASRHLGGGASRGQRSAVRAPTRTSCASSP